MRLHRLSVQAFGPFAGSEQVDLDALAADGLFLLHGRTGAGKTSVLDAVCFALYGAVPGARAAAAPDLRSHHAAPDLPPVVELELTVAGRRLRVERSPAWQRPKRRGEGTTTEQARTLLSEHDPGHPEAGDDGWRPLSARNDEASQLVTDLLGMGLAQFATVVLLPQGQFAAFLRSGVAERRALLQHLFATDRFERAERWLVAERTRTAAALERATAALASTAELAEHTAAEWAPAPPADGPETIPEKTPDGPGQLGQLVDRVAQLAGAVRGAAASADAHRASTSVRAREAEARLHAARTAAERAQRLADLHAQRRALHAAEPGVAAQRTELVAAVAAAGLAGHLHAVRAADTALHDSATRAATAAARLAGVAGGASGDGDGGLGAGGGPPTSQHLRERAAEHRREQGRLSELVALERELATRQAQAREVAAEHEQVHARQQRVELEREQHAQRRAELAAQLGSTTDLASLAPAATAALEESERVLEHARAAAALDVRRAAAAEDAREAALVAVEARTGWLDARQRRLDGVAAELAARLQPGTACPVCGACEHPAPAAPPAHPETGAAVGAGSGSGAAAAEDAAQLRWDRAEAAARSAQQRLDDLQRELVAARARAGDLDTGQATTRVEELRERAAAASSAAAAVERLRAQLSDVETADTAAVRAQEQVAASLARLGERAEQLAAGLARDSERLERARGGQEGLAARSAHLAVLADAAEQLAAATEAEAAARTAAQAARDAAAGAAADAGFPGLAAAALAERPAGERRRLQEAVAEHERASARVLAQLEELGAGDPVDDPADIAVHDPVDDLVAARDAAQRERQEADAADDAAVRAAERARSAALVLERLEAEVRERAGAARPLALAAEVAGDLARCAEGTGGGNTRRMKLSTFVLAARLEQVAVSASERLEVMSDGRYRLVHTDALERRGAGSGLGLRVLDAWTGVERDVATLSGGETFMASLALALGLADVVRAEGGGTPVETLFVDEGFGTLDPESLEEVMGVLEQLRAGGRAVGLVSHVPELRTRVPARLEVQRTATGSRLRTVLG